MPGIANKAPTTKRISVKPLEPSQELSTPECDTVDVGKGETPSQKTKIDSIHDILKQLKVSPNSPDAKAGKEASKRWQSSAKKIYAEFCTDTSFTAITRIYKATSIIKKLAWLAISLLFIVWMTIQIVWLFQKYFSYPVEVKVNLNAVSKMEFPSITICNLNPLRRDKMAKGAFEPIFDILQLNDTDMLYDDYMADLKNMWEAENTTFDINNATFMTEYMQSRSYNKWEALDNDTEIAERFYKQLADETKATMAYSVLAATLDGRELIKYGHKKKDLIMSCTWQGMGCSPSNFTYLRNNIYGNCFTFNAFDNGQESVYTNYAGPMMGLSLELNIEQHEYVPALAPDAGVRILVHDRGEYPFPEDEGMSIAPGFKTSFGLKKRELIRLEPPHGECGEGGNGVPNMYTEDFGTSYSKRSCFKSCFQRALVDQCGCALSFFYVPKNTTVCTDCSSCIENNMNNVMEDCNTKCPPPCKEVNYDVTMSLSKWPSKQYERHLDKKIMKSQSHFMDEKKREDSADTLAKVVIYFEDLIYEKVEQEKAYESQNLISDIGGQLGLWLGLSAITIGEVVEFIAAICQLATLKKDDEDGKKTTGKDAGTAKVAPLSA